VKVRERSAELPISKYRRAAVFDVRAARGYASLRRVARIARNPGGVSRKKRSAVEPANGNQRGLSGFVIACRTPRPMLGADDQVCSHGVLMNVL
jgi:hypothetical protein